MIEEGLRMAGHPGIVFRSGPAGRRPGLPAGPDAAEVISLLLHLDATGEAAVEETARSLDLPVPAVRTAVGYYVEFREEVDAELDARRTAAEEERRRFQEREQLLG